MKAFAFFPPSLLPVPTILLAGLLEILNKLNDKLEALQLALEQYLETKRRVFPRLYFVSNDDILEILAHSKRPDLMQPHIRKLFANIKSLKLSKVILRLSILLYSLPPRKRIVSRLLISHLSVFKTLTGKHVADGMYSNEEEYIEFLEPVLLEGRVEYWLRDVGEFIYFFSSSTSRETKIDY